MVGISSSKGWKNAIINVKKCAEMISNGIIGHSNVDGVKINAENDLRFWIGNGHNQESLS